MIPPGHTQIPKQKLREEGEVKAGKHKEGRKLRQRLIVHATKHFRPPEMQPTHKPHNGSTHHHIVKVSHHKVGVMQVNIGAQGRQEQSGKATNGEKPDEPIGKPHGAVVNDGATPHGPQPGEDLDTRGNGDRESEQREKHRSVRGYARSEHVVRPHDETEDSNCQTGTSNHLVTKNRLTAESGNQFACHT